MLVQLNPKCIAGLESSNTENYSNNDYYPYIQKNEVTYTYICQTTAQHVDIRDNYKHQE